MMIDCVAFRLLSGFVWLFGFAVDCVVGGLLCLRLVCVFTDLLFILVGLLFGCLVVVVSLFVYGCLLGYALVCLLDVGVLFVCFELLLIVLLISD